LARASTFTNYIRTDLDPRSGTAYRQLETIANRTYDSIARHALGASSASARVDPSRASRGGAAFALQTAAASKAAQTLAATEARISGVALAGSAALARNATSTRHVATETTLLNRNLNTLASTLNVVQGPLGPLAGRVRAIGTAVTELAGIRLGLAAGAASIFAFASASNQFVNVENKLRPLYETQTQVNSALRDVERAAIGAHAALAPTADLYSKLTAAGRDFRIEQSKINIATSVAAKAATISGSSTEGRAAGLFQFAQGIASNTLGGDELKSIRENIPELARALAKGLGVQVGDLKKLGSEGKLSAQAIVDALAKAEEEINLKFSRIPKTLSVASTEFGNAFTLMIGRADQAVGVTSKLANVVSVLAENMRTVAALSAGVGAAFIAPRITAAAKQTVAETRQQFAGGATVYGPARPTEANVALGNARAARLAADENVAATQRELAARQANVAALREETGAYTAQIGKAREQAAAALEASAAQRAAATAVTMEIREQIAATGQSAEAIAAAATADVESNGARISAAEARIALLRAERVEIVETANAQAAAASTARQAAVLRAAQATGGGGQAYAAGINAGNAEKQAAAATTALARTRQQLVAIDAELAATESTVVSAMNAQTIAAERAAAAEQILAANTAETNAVRQSTVAATYAQRQRAAAAALTAEVKAMQQAEIAATGATVVRTTAIEAETVAMRAAALGTRALKGAMDLLKTSLPILAITGLVTVLTYLATAESQAEANARLLEDAQNKLSGAIDFNTGKIKEQNKAKLAGLNLDLQTGLKAAGSNYRTARSELANLGGRIGGRDQAGSYSGYIKLTDAEKKADALFAAYRKPGSTMSAESLQTSLDELAKSEPRLKAVADAAARVSSNVVDSAQAYQKLTAQQRLLTGDNTLENRQRAQGDFSPVAKPGTTGNRSKAQIEAAAAAEAAQTELERARANLKSVRANGAQQGESEIDYQHRLAAAIQGVKSATEAQASARKADTAGRVQARAAARDAIQDARDEAEQRQNLALLTLARSGKDPNSDEYIQQREQILATYDKEVNALDASRAASNSAARAQIQDALKVRAAAASAGEAIADIASRYDTAPRALDRARADVRDLLALVGQQVDGIAPKTAENPTGRRRFTTEDYEQRAAGVQTGLRKPFQDMLDDYAREEEIQKALLDGRTAEAQALRQKFELVDRVGVLEAGQYDRLLQAADRQERVNAILQDRERITATLSGVVDDMRSSVEELLADLPNNAPKAAAGFAKRLFASYQGASARIVTDQLFGGVDQRVKDLISGRDAVQRATDFAATQFGTTGMAAQSLAGAFNTAKDFMLRLVGQTPGTNTAPLSAPASTEAPVNPYLPRATLPSGVLPEGTTFGALLNPGNSVDAVLRLASGRIDSASTILSEQIASAAPVTAFDATTASAGSLRAGIDGLTSSVNAAASAAAGMANGLAAGPIGGQSQATTQALVDVATKVSSAVAESGEDIIVTAKKQVDRGVIQDPFAGKAVGVLKDLGIKLPDLNRQKPPSIREVYNETGKAIGEKLDNALGTKFLGSLGAKFGDALKGAGTGQLASGIASKLGIKQSQTGAAIGGAIGGATGIPGADIVGGLIGGTVGGLFKKTKSASAGVTIDGFGAAAGAATGTKSRQAGATSLAGGVASSIQQIADQLGLSLSGSSNVKIGTYKDQIRVSTNGTPIGGKGSKGAITFADEQQAIEYAVRDMISDGVLPGMSAASKRILLAGKDLSKQLEKATLIESIPKRLLRLTDPVRAAVTELNDEFMKIKAALDEGGASAEQYAQAQKLYDLERVQAIQSAQTATSTAIDDFLKQLNQTSDSPLNKATVYDNANATFQKLVSDVQAGKVVDADALVEAGKNFNDASRALNGSSSGYFSDFDFLRQILEKGKTNAAAAVTGLPTSDLPGSPFGVMSDAISASSNATVQATNQQTAVLNQSLQAILQKLGGAGVISSMDNLAAFRQTGFAYAN
jgi:tape measure domain-containing protein